MAVDYLHPTGAHLTSSVPIGDGLGFVDRSATPSETTYTGTVPASAPYILRNPCPDGVIVATVGGSPRTVIEGDAAASGQIAINRSTAVWTFHSSDAGGAVSLTFVPFGSLMCGEHFLWLQQKIQEGAPLLGSVSSVNLKSVANSTIWTATADSVLTECEMKVTTASGSGAAPVVSIAIGSAGAVLAGPEEMLGADAVNRVWRFTFSGGGRVVTTGQVVEARVESASGLTTHAGRFRLFGRGA